ncbi:MAG: AAA family ATPase [Moraxellaceae bacterium]|nr:AAA family ATPase [Moraxellaceae bacterium]
MQAQNIIFTGVAGTGKTYRLQQLAKEYTEIIQPIAQEQTLALMLQPLRWHEVICLIFLECKQQGQDLLKVAEIVEHKFFQAKANLNNRNENLKATAWGTLQQYTSLTSKTVNYKNKASQAFFDKDTTSSWYLLDSALPLLTDLQNQLDDYQNNSLKPTKKERFSFVSFHQNYGYDEFVEGIRPIIDETTGQMTYKIKAGAFLRLCEKANADPQHRYAMLIDEINRANVMQVFGELMSLIEPNKRQGQSDEMAIELAYSGKLFTIPNNIDIFATMNTQDYSLVNLDSAFRRRFQFVEILPNSEGLGEISDIYGNMIDLAKVLDGLNQKIIENLGEQYQLGQAYFYPIKDIYQLVKVMVRQILPQLISHASHQPQVLDNILNLQKTHWLVNYRINPKLYNSEKMEEFLTVGAFESFYK